MVPAYKLCDFPGCNKFRVIGHKCTTHGKPPVPVKTEAPAAVIPVVEKKKPSIPLVTKEALEGAGINIESYVVPVISNTAPPVTEPKSDIHSIDLIDLFKQRQLEELDAFVRELQKLPTPFEKLQYAYQVLNS
jgi:hypothetical protein